VRFPPSALRLASLAEQIVDDQLSSLTLMRSPYRGMSPSWNPGVMKALGLRIDLA
jgi:hypothetical protein